MTTDTLVRSTVGPSQTDRPRRRYFVTAVVAMLALVLGLLGPWAWAKISGPSAKDLIEADPPPTLFSTAAIKPVDCAKTQEMEKMANKRAQA